MGDGALESEAVFSSLFDFVEVGVIVRARAKCTDCDHTRVRISVNTYIGTREIKGEGSMEGCRRWWWCKDGGTPTPQCKDRTGTMLC